MGLDDKNRGVGNVLSKRLLGVPTQFGVSDSEQALKIGKKQLDVLEDMKRSQRTQQSHNSAVSAPQAAPEIHVNVQAIGQDFRPELNELADTQRELADATNHLGYVGEMALRQSTLQSNLLGHLGQQGRMAFDQRNAALDILSEITVEHDRTNQLLHTGNQLTSRSNGLLYTGNQLTDRSNSLLHTGNQLAAGIGYEVVAVKNALLQGFGELGGGIAQISNQLVTSTVAIVDQLRGSEDVFLWAQREQSRQLQEVIHRLENPIGMRSQELWRLGEVARRAGQPGHAANLLRRCLDENPTFERAYYSLAIMAVDEGRIDDARKLMEIAISYSFNQPKLQAALLLIAAKIERMDNRIPRALRLAEQSFSTDHLNLEIWYELACLYAASQNHERTRYFLNNLLFVAQQKGSRYIAKIYATPILFSYLP